MRKTVKMERPIRRRHEQKGSKSHPYCVRMRCTQEVSARLASIQGLCFAFGEREKLQTLFERVCLPALSKYVRPYAKAAEKFRREEMKRRQIAYRSQAAADAAKFARKRVKKAKGAK